MNTHGIASMSSSGPTGIFRGAFILTEWLLLDSSLLQVEISRRVHWKLGVMK